MTTVTCHTPGCGNDGYTIDLGEVDPLVSSVSCGVCGQPITDVEPPLTPPDPDGPPVLDNTLPEPVQE